MLLFSSFIVLHPKHIVLCTNGDTLRGLTKEGESPCVCESSPWPKLHL